MRTALITLLAAALSFSVGVHTRDGDVSVLLERASRYVEEYERQWSAVVCEERQTQRVVKSDGATGKTRELVSDFLLIKLGDQAQPFRDVIAVDGKPVRNRQDRLRKLFLGQTRDPLKQARAISDESRRYNIGFSRGIEALMLPLAITREKNTAGFRFARAGDGLTFEEFQSPSMVRYSRGRDNQKHDMPLHGALTIEADTGRLSDARLVADSPLFVLTVNIRYALDAATRLLMPVESREDYRTPDSKDTLRVSSTYSNFRRFQVTTDERFDPPAGNATGAPRR